MKKNILIIGVLAAAIAGYYCFINFSSKGGVKEELDPTPQNVTLSGSYVCLPHLDTTGPQTEECAFGLKTDGGDYYAVNFGELEGAMDQFKSGEHITAQGFVVIKEALSSDHWAKYNMKGVFTIANILFPAPVQGKLDITAVCEGALSYMTFPDGKSADAFVAECKEGQHPEVIERYKDEMNLGEGAAI